MEDRAQVTWQREKRHLSQETVETSGAWHAASLAQARAVRVPHAKAHLSSQSAWQSQRQVEKLQKLLLKSEAARLLAVRRVTQDNQGKKTAGVDGVKSVPPKGRLLMVEGAPLETLEDTAEIQPLYAGSGYPSQERQRSDHLAYQP